MARRRKRYLDNAAPADNTANVVSPVNRMIQVKQQDTPARREKETREYQARIERGQRIMNSFARTPAGRRAANRAYVIESQKAKQEAAKEEAAAVVGSFFKPIMPSTYVDMAAAIKNGQVNNLTDALAAPYLSNSWSMRNPGKALVTDIAAPFVLSKGTQLAKFASRDIANSWKDMRYALAHPESQVYGIVPKDIQFLTNRGDNPYIRAIRGQEEVGRLTMGKSGNAVNVHTVEVSPDLRRQGIATELYKQANRFANSIGKPLESHSFQHQLTAVDDAGRRYAPATKVWEKLIADGLATKERRGMEMVYRMNKPAEAIIDESNYLTATDDIWDAAYDKAVYDYLEDIVDNDAAVQKIRDLHFKAKAPKANIPDQYHGTHEAIKDRIRFHTANEYLPNYPFYTSSVEDYASAYGPNVYKFKVNQQLEKLARASKPTQFIRQTKDDVKALMQQGKEGTINDKLWTFNDIGYPFDEITVYDGRKYKLADAITYDKDGNIIPISKRDNFKLNNINYSWLLPFLIGGGVAVKNK